MDEFSEITDSLFLPMINVLQEQSLDKRLNFELNFQNNDLYILQEMTRSAALLNHIHCKNKRNGGGLVGSSASGVNAIFDQFLQIPDPMAVFLENFEQFFAMYVHSKYGKNNFQLYMKECEKSSVAYPINVFEDGLCIFMQYNSCELRKYVYNIMTMFFYYTGQDFYEMIRPILRDENTTTTATTTRPNTIEELDRENVLFKKTATTATTAHNTTTTREEKLCQLNRRNYNVKRPYLMQQNRQIYDNLTTTKYDNCILTTTLDRTYQPILVGGLNKPIFRIEDSTAFHVLPKQKCHPNGISKETKIFQLSDHLRRSRNFETDTVKGDNNNNNTTTYNINFKNLHYDRKSTVQTNFSQVWSCANRRQLVTLSIVHSIMNVCIQKITYSLLEKNQMNQSKWCDQTYTCVQAGGFGGGRRDFIGRVDYDVDMGQLKKILKLKKPTIEVTFNRNSLKRTQAINNIDADKLQFSV